MVEINTQAANVETQNATAAVENSQPQENTQQEQNVENTEKKTAAKKATGKGATAKKTVVKKALKDGKVETTVKKTAVKGAATKKTAAKKTAAKKTEKAPKTEKPEGEARKGREKKDGLRAPQERILKYLAKKSQQDRKQIAAGAPVDVACLVEYVGSHDDEKRAANDVKHFPSLITLGFVKAEQHDVDGKDKIVYSLTANGKKAAEKIGK